MLFRSFRNLHTYCEYPNKPPAKLLLCRGISSCGRRSYILLRISRKSHSLRESLTVVPYNEFEGTGTGFSFVNYNAHEMLATIRYAESVYYDKKREWNKLVDRAMAADFSWNNSARQYEEMYNWLIGE